MEYGPLCAAKAIDDLHGKFYQGQNLYVTAALPKADRFEEVQKVQQKYKSDSQRCTLYVEGFSTESE